ncbi:MAG: tripartite tricarboxylate transporter substrate binding protein [Betaproteobacteria bacterium]|nr:tripartite tricarboxylate transporter substrate binding protein [Betaproteobacteria bacterium]
MKLSVTALLFAAAVSTGFAQAPYPSQQIRILCPFPAGGGTDLTSRLLADQFNKIFGQPVVVENRTGASGMIGTGAAAKSPPDGYTVLVASGEVALNPHLYKQMAYDWDKDLQPITLLVKVPNLLAVNMDVPAKTVAELIAYAKQNRGKLTFSSSGVGNPQQLTGELFNKMAGVDIRHVPYKGAAPQIADVAGKHITMTFVSIGAALPFVESGRIRPIAVTSTTRVSVLPNVPAIAEYPPLASFELVNFFGFFAPAKIPDPILRRLNAAAVQALKTPEMGNKLRASGFEPSPTTPEQFRDFIKNESAKFAKIIVEANIKLDQ